MLQGGQIYCTLKSAHLAVIIVFKGQIHYLSWACTVNVNRYSVSIVSMEAIHYSACAILRKTELSLQNTYLFLHPRISLDIWNYLSWTSSFLWLSRLCTRWVFYHLTLCFGQEMSSYRYRDVITHQHEHGNLNLAMHPVTCKHICTVLSEPFFCFVLSAPRNAVPQLIHLPSTVPGLSSGECWTFLLSSGLDQMI